MFWTIVGAILFVTIGIPLIIKGIYLLFLALGNKDFRQILLFVILGILALIGVGFNLLLVGFSDFTIWLVLAIPFLAYLIINGIRLSDE